MSRVNSLMSDDEWVAEVADEVVLVASEDWDRLAWEDKMGLVSPFALPPETYEAASKAGFLFIATAHPNDFLAVPR